VRQRAWIPAAIVLAFAATACGGSDADSNAAATTAPPSATTTDEREPAPPPPPVFGHGDVVIRGAERPVSVAVEIAETDEQRRFGLMFRKFLPDEAGMVFLFAEDTTGGFWMKNTLIPLSIAFYDRTGRIVRILDMEPCTAEPCPVYKPGVAYRGALEVNRGAFERWGVEEGDRIEFRRA
jgi:uncharacterized membrane protein (UPF0127 family)